MTNKEAIEIIKTAIAQVEWDYPMDYAAAFDKAIEALEAPKSSWVSVKDRLPDVWQEVLVFAIGKSEGFVYGAYVFAMCKRVIERALPSSEGFETWSTPWHYFHADYEITHWMPLPPKPKEEAE